MMKPSSRDREFPRPDTSAETRLPESHLFLLTYARIGFGPNGAVDELRSRSQTPAEGVVLHDVAEGFECRLTAVAHRHHAEHLDLRIPMMPPVYSEMIPPIVPR
jgi:hypothetical protein